MTPTTTETPVFEPSPALAQMERRALQLRRNVAMASLFNPRLHRRAATATMAARLRYVDEMKKWEAR